MAARRTKKKTTPKTGAVAVRQGAGLPDSLRKKFARFREQQAASTPASGGVPTIRTGNGLFTFPGSDQGDETFRAVALCALRRNTYWAGAYQPGAAEPPTCSAIANLGEHENAMVPHPGYEVQHPTCVGCPRNVAPQKKCRNGIDVALVHVDQVATPAKVANASIARLRLSATAIAPFGTVVKHVAEAGAPLFLAVLEFSQVMEEGTTYWSTRAAPVDWVSEKVADALSERVKEAADLLVGAVAPAPQVEADGAGEPAKPAPRRRTTKKTGGRKL